MFILGRKYALDILVPYLYFSVITDEYFRKTVATFRMIEIFEIVQLISHFEALCLGLCRPHGRQSGLQ